MLRYATMGTNDFDRAIGFYEPIAQMLGHGRMLENERTVMWGSPGDGAMLAVTRPFDGQDATGGNGTMFSLSAASQELVHQVYDHALSHGGSDEGAPGIRMGQFYGAYFRDPDGNKLAVFTILAE